MGLLNQIEVFCDEDADVKLFKRLKGLSSILNNIPDENIAKYPQISAAVNNRTYDKIFPLFAFDRPDYIFTLAGKPILVVEVTEHAYTGDNGLQRFVRVASAAENKVPFIYFGPIARVRDDELDLSNDVSTLSKRSLTSDFFEGMATLHTLYKVPMLFTEWITARNGKVKKVPLTSTDSKFMGVYGDLCSLMAAIINLARNGKNGTADSAALLVKSQAQLLDLANIKNTRHSDVKFALNRTKTIELIRNPQQILQYMSDYFFKGKPDKLLALYALRNSQLKNILLKDRIVSDETEISSFIKKICSADIFQEGAYVYFSGYKWRSDPHCGVAINIYYRECKVNKLPLVLFYPRISITSSATQILLESLNNTQNLIELFKERYSIDFAAKHRTTTSSAALYSTWIGSTKQGRIFLRYCHIIVCNDGIIIGEPLQKIL